MLKFIKKPLKYILILAVIVTLIGFAIRGGAYLLNKYETKLNLAFFTTDNYNGTVLRGINWSPTSSWDNRDGKYQSGINSEGQLFYRHVDRKANYPIGPPVVASYYLFGPKSQIVTTIYWIMDCNPNLVVEYQLDSSHDALKCSDNGKYLWTRIQWMSDSGTNDISSLVTAWGFTYQVSSSYFDILKLQRNATLIKLNKQEGD